jgi:hypothetical protein
MDAILEAIREELQQHCDARERSTQKSLLEKHPALLRFLLLASQVETEEELAPMWKQFINTPESDLGCLLSNAFYEQAMRDDAVMTSVPVPTPEMHTMMRTGKFIHDDPQKVNGGHSPMNIVLTDSTAAASHQERMKEFESMISGTTAPNLHETRQLINDEPHFENELMAHFSQLCAFSNASNAFFRPEMEVNAELRSFLKQYRIHLRTWLREFGAERMKTFLPLLANEIRLIYRSSVVHLTGPHREKPRPNCWSKLLSIMDGLKYQLLSPLIQRCTTE